MCGLSKRTEISKRAESLRSPFKFVPYHSGVNPDAWTEVGPDGSESPPVTRPIVNLSSSSGRNRTVEIFLTLRTRRGMVNGQCRLDNFDGQCFSVSAQRFLRPPAIAPSTRNYSRGGRRWQDPEGEGSSSKISCFNFPKILQAPNRSARRRSFR